MLASLGVLVPEVDSAGVGHYNRRYSGLGLHGTSVDFGCGFCQGLGLVASSSAGIARPEENRTELDEVPIGHIGSRLICVKIPRMRGILGWYVV